MPIKFLVCLVTLSSASMINIKLILSSSDRVFIINISRIYMHDQHWKDRKSYKLTEHQVHLHESCHGTLILSLYSPIYQSNIFFSYCSNIYNQVYTDCIQNHILINPLSRILKTMYDVFVQILMVRCEMPFEHQTFVTDSI